MKKILYSIATMVAVAVLLSSCVGDLDTTPISENDFTEIDAYDHTLDSYMQGAAKIYGGFVLVGPDPGTADINVGDAGASELNRAFWSIQELSTDAAKCAWENDAWVYAVNNNLWSASRNDAIFAVYNRIMMLVSYANEFLRQTTESKMSERGVPEDVNAAVSRLRSEIRYIRAYAWWMAIDIFGTMPFVTENDPVGSFLPPQISRGDLFQYVETELLALTEDPNLTAARQNTYPHVDKGCAWALLARLYLNAEVYTGTQRWADARQAAANVIGLGYTLATDFSGLFKADNSTNPNTRGEIIFATSYDGNSTQSYGGYTYIVAATMAGGDDEGKAIIGSSGWGGIRSDIHYASTYFGLTNPNFDTGEFDCPDQRAMFWIKGKEGSIEDPTIFTQGLGVTKFSNLNSAGQNMAGGEFTSTDYIMIRLAEIYLIYAEANLRAGGSASDPTSLGYLNDLRQRALQSDYTPLTSYSLEDVFTERSAELFWEGHRRTDLVRYGRYTSASFLWPWKGGIMNGRGLDSHYTLMPLPEEDRIVNPNLIYNNGY